MQTNRSLNRRRRIFDLGKTETTNNKMKLFYIFINTIIISLLTSCFYTKEAEERQSIKPIDIEQRTEDLSFSQFFDQQTITPLEMTPECMIKEINKSVYSNGLYYLLDIRQGAVFAFNTNGAFVFKIHRIGKGPEEYSSIEDFNLNPYTNTIDLLCPQGKILQYNRSNGEFVNSLSLSGIRAVHAFHQLTRDTLMFFSMYEKYKIWIYSIAEDKVVDKQHKVIPFVHKHIPSYKDYYPFYNFDNKIHLFEYYSNCIKVFENGEFKSKTQWEFGKNNFVISQIKPDQERVYYINYIKNNKHLIRFAFIHEDTNKYVLQFLYNNKFFTLIHSKNSSKYTIVSEFKEGVHFPQNPQFIDNEEFFVILPASFVKYYVLESMLNQDELLLLHNLKEIDNPVVITYRINPEQ
jgi:hypothetical protein